MKIPFYKCNGNGNSFFIIIHENTLKKNIFKKEFIEKICFYEKVNKVDGLVFINIKNNKIYMDYYNNDGTWETLCLNGLRCSALLLNSLSNESNINIYCNNHLYKTSILNDNMVKVNLNKPLYKMRNINIEGFKGDYIDVGAKHLVILFNSEWPSLEILKHISQKIRFNKSIFPDGININFYKILDNMKIQVKTYEKGVESMMQSCASGSYAAAFHYSKENNLFGSLHVLNDGGDFHISFDEKYINNTLAGKAEIEYKDFIELN
jgi:diaminopimelate epimerase